VTGGGDDPKASVETRVYSVLVPDGVSFEAARELSLSFQEERKWDEQLLIQNRSEGYQIGRYVTDYPDGTLREVDFTIHPLRPTSGSHSSSLASGGK